MGAPPMLAVALVLLALLVAYCLGGALGRYQRARLGYAAMAAEIRKVCRAYPHIRDGRSADRYAPGRYAAPDR